MTRRFWTWVLAVIVSVLASVGVVETPLVVSVCDVQADPSAYDHKLLQITAPVSLGFENFSLADETCTQERTRVWLELGGSNSQVEGVPTTLRQDEVLAKFQALTGGGDDSPVFSATLVGRYFSGTSRTYRTGQLWAGYGHLSAFSLLVIQQVVAVEPLPAPPVQRIRPR